MHEEARVYSVEVGRLHGASNMQVSHGWCKEGEEGGSDKEVKEKKEKKEKEEKSKRKEKGRGKEVKRGCD